MSQEGKSIHVFFGGQLKASDENIYAVIESKALESGLNDIGKTLEEVITYHAVARPNQATGKPDLSVDGGMFPGTWMSGSNRNAVLTVAHDEFAKLPEK